MSDSSEDNKLIILKMEDAKNKGCLVSRLSLLIDELKYGQETHRIWRDCDQRFRDENPSVGDKKFHEEMFIIYQHRIDAILDTIDFLKQV